MKLCEGFHEIFSNFHLYFISYNIGLKAINQDHYIILNKNTHELKNKSPSSGSIIHPSNFYPFSSDFLFLSSSLFFDLSCMALAFFLLQMCAEHILPEKAELF